MKEIITDSIRYWESRRIAYNAALAAVLAASFLFHWSGPEPMPGWQQALGLFLAAIVANVLYCAAYPADFLFQASEYRNAWRRFRWLLLVVGTAFAAALFLVHE